MQRKSSLFTGYQERARDALCTKERVVRNGCMTQLVGDKCLHSRTELACQVHSCNFSSCCRGTQKRFPVAFSWDSVVVQGQCC